jgi:IMP-specific 5'-nucleotidase
VSLAPYMRGFLPFGGVVLLLVSFVSWLQGSFFTPLKLVDAFLEYDEFFALSRRKYVPPNFAEMRHVLNIAQVHDALITGVVVAVLDACAIYGMLSRMYWLYKLMYA